MAGRGTRRYEFAVLVVIVGLLALLLMQSLERTGRDIEEATVQSEIAALRIELLDYLAHREAQGGGLPASRNPVRWVKREPAGYRGELDSAPKEKSLWYFDVRREVLVYRFRDGREALFRLERGAAAANAPAGFAGVGLRRLEVRPEDVK